MRRISRAFQVSITSTLVLGLLVIGMPTNVGARAATAPSLVISLLKITSSNGQFVTLYNATDAALDMSTYQLEYFNNYDLAKATSSRLISLEGILPPHSFYMVNDSSLLLCYRLTVDSISMGFSSTAGMLQVINLSQASPGALVGPTVQDYVAWSRMAASGAQTLPTVNGSFLSRTPTGADHFPNITSPGSGGWQIVQPDPNNACRLVTTGSVAQPVQTGMSQLLASEEPLALIISTVTSGSEKPSATGIPTRDIGLKAPIITEILPNPSGSGTDSTDEFIEIYNPNPKSFDLSGFVLQSGITTLHKFVFPPGSNIAAKRFAAYFSRDTKATQTNTTGIVRLLDPLGNSISATAEYTKAKDGLAWALANGKWYWTTQPTPGSTNKIVEPQTKKKTKYTSAHSKTSISDGSKNKTVNSSFLPQGEIAGAPVHVWVIALIASGALLYATYEYKNDLANKVHQFKKYLADRRSNRVKTEG